MASQWYIAEIVMEITVAEDPRNVVHQNFVLISANSAGAAYDKASTIGTNGETSYLNPDGKLVQIRFRGIADLDAIYEDLEDGAEVMFRYRVGVSSEELRSSIPGRERLRAFLPPKRAQGPDYASAEVIGDAKRLFGADRPIADDD